MQSSSAVILEPPKIKSATISTVSPPICTEVMGMDAMILVFWMLSFQFSSVTQSCATLCYHMDCSTPGFPVRHQHPELAQTHVHRAGDAIQPSHPLPSPSSHDFNLSQHGDLFQWVSFFCIRWPEYQSFNFSISPSNDYSGLISFRIDWLDLLAVQGTFKSLLQYHSPSLWCNSHIHTWKLEKP